MQVHRDGRLAKLASTRSSRTAAAQVLLTLNVRYGRHTVKVVNAGGTLTIDGFEFWR